MTESSSLEGAVKRINEIAGMARLTVPPSCGRIPGPREWDL